LLLLASAFCACALFISKLPKIAEGIVWLKNFGMRDVVPYFYKMPLPLTTNATVVKEYTQALHTGVESLLLPKLQSLQTHNEYAAILQMFYGYFSPLEGAIEQFITADEMPDMAERRKALVILQDLQALGCSVRGLPVCTELPIINNTTSAFGALYVLEGSTLGGKMIARMLMKNTELSLPENAIGFFSGYREKTGDRWKTFLAELNKQEDAETVAHSANDTFFALKRWMQQTLYND
jgi:heme oxygenase